MKEYIKSINILYLSYDNCFTTAIIKHFNLFNFQLNHANFQLLLLIIIVVVVINIKIHFQFHNPSWLHCLFVYLVF